MAAAVVAWKYRKLLVGLACLCVVVPLMLAATLVSVVGGIVGSGSASVDGFGPSPDAVADIPAVLLAIYQKVGSDEGLDWTYLAAIGKVESDHCRLKALGVTSGANSAGAGGCMQFIQSTWDAYGVDGNGDGRKSRYDPEDAIPGAAKYLKASGAPDDWSRAIFAYNHAGWYVDMVLRQAEKYRGAALAQGGPLAGSGVSQALTGTGDWKARVPGTGAVCDRRIVADVVMLMKRYKLALGDCFAMTGHAIDGEHPIGLGLDFGPGAGGSWALVGQLMRDIGWRDSCASSGCAGRLPAPFRFAGWNGYPGHGDLPHAGPNAHGHLSWQHTPAAPNTPAARVQTLIGPTP